MAQTLGIVIELASSTKILVKTGRIGGWGEDVPTLLSNIKLNINGIDISPDSATSGYDATGVMVPPFIYLTHIFTFTVPSGTTSGAIKYKDTSADAEQTINFTSVGSTSQIVSNTPGRYRIENKNQTNLRFCPSGNNAVAQDTTTTSQVSHQLNHLGGGVYQLQHVNTGLCLSSGGGSENIGQQCTYKASDTNDTTQKFTAEPNGSGGVILRFVSNPARSISLSSGNLVLANYSANNTSLAWLFQTIEDSAAVSGGGGGSGIVLIVTGVTDNTVSLDWPDVSGATIYEVERSPTGVDGTWTYLFGQGASNVNNSGLNSNTTYWYRVRAVVNGVPQQYSNKVSATTTGGVGIGTTGTPTISDNALGQIWNLQCRLEGLAAANSTVRIYNGTALLKTVIAGTDSKWVWDIAGDKQQMHLPITSQLNATAQLTGQNVSAPSANKTVVSTPSSPVFLGLAYTNINSNTSEYYIEQMNQVSTQYARKNPPVQIGATQGILNTALEALAVALNS